LQPSLAVHGRYAVIGCKLKQNANDGCNSCASLAGLVLSCIARFILLVTAPLGQYREAATDLQHAVSLLRAIYTSKLVPFQQHQSSDGSDHRDDGVVAAVGTLIDTVALIGDELAERTQIERPGALEQTNLSAGNVSAAVAERSAASKRYSHADELFQVAHIFHLCSIVILGVFVVEVILTRY